MVSLKRLTMMGNTGIKKVYYCHLGAQARSTTIETLPRTGQRRNHNMKSVTVTAQKVMLNSSLTFNLLIVRKFKALLP